MPEVTDQAFQSLLNDCLQNAVSVTLHISSSLEAEALKLCNDYLSNGNLQTDLMTPLSVYYIISKLPKEKQIDFIQQNINYIREHDEDVFLYNMLAPKALSYFLSLHVLKEIKNIDINIFKKIISCNQENLFNGYSHEDYIEFFTIFYEDILKLDNRDFIDSMYFHNRCCYDYAGFNDINKAFTLQKQYNIEFEQFLLNKYREKITSFTPSEALKFIAYISDLDTYKPFIADNYDKLNKAFSNISEDEISEYLSETDHAKQEVLLYTFFDQIIKKRDIKKIVDKIEPDLIIQLYNQNKEVFESLTLKDWIQLCAKERTFNESFQRIIDTFEIKEVESLFNTSFYLDRWYRKDVEALKDVEMKYRKCIQTNGFVEPIDETTSIFSNKYLKNLKEIQEKLKNKTITRSDEQYKKMLAIFILFLKNQNIINSMEENNFKEIEKLFYRIVLGSSMTILYQVKSIEEIAILNRLGHIDFDVRDFTVQQLEKYNVKQHKQLYERFKDSSWYLANYKKLTLKLFLMVGFHYAKAILDIDDTIPVLEHLVGNVDVKNIFLNEQGQPILNPKISHLLFPGKDCIKIREMLKNKDGDLYRLFPRIFSEWEMICINGKDESLHTIINYLKSDEISVPPEYYRLVGLFKYIGCSNSIVNETLALHDQMLERKSSSIPRVVGSVGEYSYEVLKFDDMDSLVVGNKTRCCFTVLGNGYSCLKHAVTCKNGRILVIKKNGEIFAHSWLWRNGDLVCLDNIEISKKINEVDFFDVYLQIFDEILASSFRAEGIESCIKNITIGFTNFDKKIHGIESYPCIVAKTCNLKEKGFDERLGKNRIFVDILPQPLEEVGYSDSKNVQYLIRGNRDFHLGPVWYDYGDDQPMNQDKLHSKEGVGTTKVLKLNNPVNL